MLRLKQSLHSLPTADLLDLQHHITELLSTQHETESIPTATPANVEEILAEALRPEEIAEHEEETCNLTQFLLKIAGGKDLQRIVRLDLANFPFDEESRHDQQATFEHNFENGACLDDEAFESLVPHICRCSRLRILNLKGNRVTKRSGAHLLPIVTACTELEELDLYRFLHLNQDYDALAEVDLGAIEATNPSLRFVIELLSVPLSVRQVELCLASWRLELSPSLGRGSTGTVLWTILFAEFAKGHRHPDDQKHLQPIRRLPLTGQDLCLDRVPSIPLLTSIPLCESLTELSLDGMPSSCFVPSVFLSTMPFYFSARTPSLWL
eukprot:m.146142 g.146142  ORF g.146142 m.146142 type:complete len:324 (+) comp52704_c0_seq4:116-1087(+)